MTILTVEDCISEGCRALQLGDSVGAAVRAGHQTLLRSRERRQDIRNGASPQFCGLSSDNFLRAGLANQVGTTRPQTTVAAI